MAECLAILLSVVAVGWLPVVVYHATRQLWPNWPYPLHVTWLYVTVLGTIGLPLLMYWSITDKLSSDFYNTVSLFCPFWLATVVLLWIVTIFVKARAKE